MIIPLRRTRQNRVILPRTIAHNNIRFYAVNVELRKYETNLNGKFMNKRKLRVLNPAEMRPLTGGTDTTYKCNKSGDTIICGFPADVKACINLEGKCPSKFSSECSVSSSITITCPSKFTIGKE